MIEGLLKMSATGAVAIAVVLLLRLCLRRLPKIFCYALWAVVLFRLLCPVSVALPLSAFNLFGIRDAERGTEVERQLGPRSEPGNGQAVLTEQEKTPAGGSNAPAAEQKKSGEVSEIPVEKAQAGWQGICTVVWLIGVAAMCVYGVHDIMRLRRQIRGASLDRDNVYLLEGIASPFVAGIVRPRIYLPCALAKSEREYVLLHERTHIKRGDPIFRALAYAALIVHWFNPLVWVAFFVSGRDMEMSCDELVLRKLGTQIKREYSNSLLVMAQGKGLVTNISLAFGEGDTGKRIKNVLNYKKATVQAIALGALVVALALVALGTNPTEQASAEDSGGRIGRDADDQAREAASRTGADADQADVLTIELLCQIADEGGLADCDFRRFSNAVYDPLGDEALNYYESITFETGSGDVVLDASYMKEDVKDSGEYAGVLDAVYLTRKSDEEVLLLYSRDPRYGTGTPPGGADIEAFVAADFDILNEISFELPKGLTLEPYSANVGYGGGRLFSPDVYEGTESTPSTWTASGSVSRFDAEQLLVWEDGEITDVHSYQNHAVITGKIQFYDPDVVVPALLVTEEYDLYTVPEMYELDEKGVSYEPTSSYWCLYVAKEDAPYGYVVSLNEKNFTEDDMLSLAKTIRLTDEESAPPREADAAETDGTDAPDKQSFVAQLSVRSISRSLPGIDRYVAPDEAWEETYGDTLVFADDCKYFINESSESMSPHEVNFVTFAEAIDEGDPVLNKPCEAEIQEDGLIHAITLVSGRYQNGVSYAAMGPWGFFEDTAALYPDYAKAFPIVRTETADIASAPGEETIEIRKGHRDSDGIDGADVIFRDQKGNVLYSVSVTDEGMCLKNIYVGRMDGAGDPYILEVSLENRDTYGEYSYYVYTLGSVNGTYVQTTGSRIEWQKDGPLVYDAAEMSIFFHMLGHYLDGSHLLAGTAWNGDGEMEIRTEPVCDADLFTYKNLKPPCFPDPYEGADVR